jgi:spore germination protein GerM
MSSSRLNFQQTVDLLSQTLPVRALHWLEENGDITPERRTELGWTDDAAIDVLLQRGIPNVQVTRNAVRECLADILEDSDVFSLVNPLLSGERNPFVAAFRTLLQGPSDDSDS